jgi:hypothetical protein
MDLLVGLCVGIGLSAACGFRIFVPPLLMSLAATTGYYDLPTDLAWMGTYPALTALAIATGIEALAYYIPWVDNALDVLEVPLAAVAGTVITAGFASDAFLSVIPEVHPLVLWSFAAIAGGGAAEATEGLTLVTRLASTATTGGLGNPILATMELLSALVLSLLSLLAPFLAVGLVVLFVWWAVTKVIPKLMRRRTRLDEPEPPSPRS